MKIICATMVKDESDIVEKWIQYYGKIFSFPNLYIIDNYSTDRTYEICKKYISRGVKVFQEKNYKHKGEFMTKIKNSVNCDFFLPIDIDEFIVYFDKQPFVQCDNIIDYFSELKNTYPNDSLFKMSEIHPIRTNNNPELLTQFTHGNYTDIYIMSKSFLQSKNIKLTSDCPIDHGNHMPNKTYIATKLAIIHYHTRSEEQIRKKITNNITGLGYIIELGFLKKLVGDNKEHLFAGKHHVLNAISILENRGKKLGPPIHENAFGISLSNFIEFIN